MSGRHGTAHGRPKHAGPSLLAPSRALITIAVFLALAAGAVAAVAGGSAGAAAPRAAGYSVVNPAARDMQAPVAQLQADLGGLALSPADRAALLEAGVDGDTVAAVQDGAARGFSLDAAALTLASSGIPFTALVAYEKAAGMEAISNPTCGLTWPLLAGIGRVESDHGRFAGAVLDENGLSDPPVVGIPLDGHGTALIRDTDDGALDGDTVYDRAVGPMQFIPSTWAGWGVDANDDGVKDPFNLFDAAAAAADYLCAAGGDLTTESGQIKAILTYNHSYDYVSAVMSVEHAYAVSTGMLVPVLSSDPGHGRPDIEPDLPPADPGPPRGAPDPSDPVPSDKPGDDKPTPGPTTAHSESPTPAPSTTYTRQPVPVPGGGSSSTAEPTPTVPAPTTPPTTPVPTTPMPTPCDTAAPSLDPSCPSPTESAATSAAAETSTAAETVAAETTAAETTAASEAPSTEASSEVPMTAVSSSSGDISPSSGP